MANEGKIHVDSPVTDQHIKKRDNIFDYNVEGGKLQPRLETWPGWFCCTNGFFLHSYRFEFSFDNKSNTALLGVDCNVGCCRRKKSGRISPDHRVRFDGAPLVFIWRIPKAGSIILCERLIGWQSLGGMSNSRSFIFEAWPISRVYEARPITRSKEAQRRNARRKTEKWNLNEGHRQDYRNRMMTRLRLAASLFITFVLVKLHN